LITKQLVDKIEGEASLYFELEDEKVSFATVSFPHTRGMELMLEGKNALDALVITPRVCGICGHAHLMATVRAIEDAYKNAGYEIHLSEKVELLREFTLVMEMVQNHFKWMYLTIIPALSKLTNSSQELTPLKGAFAASIATKAIATFAGQWPHSSYMIPGGVTADPTNIDILKAQSYLSELKTFFEKESLGVSLEDFLAFDSCNDFTKLSSDVGALNEALLKTDMHIKGFADDTFIVLGEHTFTEVTKLKHTRHIGVQHKYVSTEPSYSPHEKTYAKNALYKDAYYETGPLARSLSNNFAIIKNIHRRYKDSAYSRVMARVFELASLIQHASSLLKKLDIADTSFTKSVDISKINARGVGVVEAPRGPLMHTIDIENGVIKKYSIITPTQWNIGSSHKEKPTPAQRAMIGLTKEEANFVFRTFDVCSVCTTH